jgi:phosphonate transport system permease protein
VAQPLITLPDQRLAALAADYERKTVARRRLTYAILAAVLVLSAAASVVAEVDLGKLIANFGNFTTYFYNILPVLRAESLWADLSEWMWGLEKWAGLLLDTLLIAYLGTLFGVIGGFLLCFAASANLVTNATVRFAARRFLEFCRTVPELVFALIFVIAFGLGPMPGVLAIAIHTMGALGKLFAEVAENIDMKPVEGVRACGASWPEMIRYGVIPQVLPGFASYGLLRFEINVRSASIMGFVGAGGIGQDLLEAIRSFYYSDVSAILVLIILTVFTIDIATERLRHSLIGRESR